MIKEIGPEQEEHLEALSTARTELDEIKVAEEAATKRFRSLIRDGFRKDISGIKLAERSGLSLPRIYQIRNES